ncbi:cysteine dioxygenase type I [Aeromicrobium marinum DSM 15272]|uniref:Cysteine dioxygenase type I n=1 Tax=Aeromicrobium marinum DSM 15272 TaxID=585531 RepID=E2SBZ5_9ACTN|nr:cysteine dioxygenase family protein [Aeromicrobium marinum]EFQ83281.1 cysteine dioxygenase type I [Aeromicrobium marinum DSM 15272]
MSAHPAPARKSAATPLSLAELVGLTTAVAADVRAGLYAVEADVDHRWHVRLHRDAQVDIWLISWTTEQGTQLHDHGGSAGAFTVVEGALTESVWTGVGELHDNERSTGETVRFGEHYVHDVRNTAAATAVSVHAYSTPLERMNFYDVAGGRLERLASVWTDDPEAPAPESVRDRLREAS